jgi:hypothetical protein
MRFMLVSLTRTTGNCPQRRPRDFRNMCCSTGHSRVAMPLWYRWDAPQPPGRKFWRLLQRDDRSTGNRAPIVFLWFGIFDWRQFRRLSRADADAFRCDPSRLLLLNP